MSRPRRPASPCTVRPVRRRLTLAALLAAAAPSACGQETDPPRDREMRVEPGAAMDTTPAGTPAPPPLETLR